MFTLNIRPPLDFLAELEYNARIMKREHKRTQPDEQTLRHLTQCAQTLVNQRRYQMGYPFDQDINLAGFYQWLIDTGLCDTTLISVGSPYKDAWDMLHVDEFERAIVDFYAQKYGFPANSYWGFTSNGGTDGNMHGLYFGRKCLAAQSDAPLILYVSSEAHYSMQKLGDVLNLETRVIKALPGGQMDAVDFRTQLNPDRPALVGIAVGGTFKGAIDNQTEIDAVLKEVNPPAYYRHLDVALFGGYLPWLDDPEAQNVLNQKERQFDSLAVSGHKFLAMNEPTGVFVCRKDILESLHNVTVPYLNCVIPTISCSRSGFDALKLYWRLKTTGEDGFQTQARRVLLMTAKLVSALEKRGVKPFVNKWSNTVLFPRPAEEIAHKYCMACSGEWSHVVVMQYFDEELIEQLTDDIASSGKSVQNSI